MSGQWSGEIADVHAKWIDGKVELVWPENEQHLPALANYEAIQSMVDDVNRAVIRTEERIIKLLEEPLLQAIGQASTACWDSAGVFDAEEAIAIKDSLLALIKGEKNG